MAQPVRLRNIVCVCVLFSVVAQQNSFAQCGQATQQPAVSTAPNVAPPPKATKASPENLKVVLRLERNTRGMVRDIEVLEDAGNLRTNAIPAAVRFANSQTYYDRITLASITVVVKFHQNAHGTLEVWQRPEPGVLGCISSPPPIRTVPPPSWLFNTRPVIPVLAASGTEQTTPPQR